MSAEEHREEVQEVQPSCKGPTSTHVKIISGDDHVFIVPRRVIKYSETLNDMLKKIEEIQQEEGDENVVKLNEIKSSPLSRLLEYLVYYDRNQESWYAVPDFPIDENFAPEILVAACFLKV